MAKKGIKLRKDSMLYSWAAELIEVGLQKEGLDPALYGIHSVQAGSATTAAALVWLQTGKPTTFLMHPRLAVVLYAIQGSSIKFTVHLPRPV